MCIGAARKFTEMDLCDGSVARDTRTHRDDVIKDHALATISSKSTIWP